MTTNKCLELCSICCKNCIVFHKCHVICESINECKKRLERIAI
jgi:hypothetical protein